MAATERGPTESGTENKRVLIGWWMAEGGIRMRMKIKLEGGRQITVEERVKEGRGKNGEVK